MEVRPGWTLGIGAIFAVVAIVLGFLMIINVAPDNPLDVGLVAILLGISRIVP